VMRCGIAIVVKVSPIATTAKFLCDSLRHSASARTSCGYSEGLNLAVFEVFPYAGEYGGGKLVLVLWIAQLLFFGGI